jgi:hypothetical protein
VALLPDQLSSVGAKIQRSTQHFKTLNREITEYLDSGAYEAVHSFDQKERLHTFRLEVRHELPMQIRLLTGEVLFQLRSALDNLAWQLALLSGQAPSEYTEFPIFSSRAAYVKKKKRKIGSMPVEAQAIVDEVQPYHANRPEDEALWVLHRLTNEDKHRLPHLAAVVPNGIFVDRRGRDLRVSLLCGGPIPNQAEFGRVQFLSRDEPDMSAEVDILFDLAFPHESVARGRTVRNELERCGQRVDAIVNRFLPFFPE